MTSRWWQRRRGGSELARAGHDGQARPCHPRSRSSPDTISSYFYFYFHLVKRRGQGSMGILIGRSDSRSFGGDSRQPNRVNLPAISNEVRVVDLTPSSRMLNGDEFTRMVMKGVEQLK